MISETDRAWLAGLVEGEGCFTTAGRRFKGLRFALHMTDEDVVRKAHAVTGFGNIRGPVLREGAKPIWDWTISATVDAVTMALWLFPYLGSRRRARICEIVDPWLELDDWGSGVRFRQLRACPQGHPYDEENTYWAPRPDGKVGKQCRTCKRAQARKTYTRTMADPIRHAEKLARRNAWYANKTQRASS